MFGINSIGFTAGKLLYQKKCQVCKYKITLMKLYIIQSDGQALNVQNSMAFLST